MKLLLLKWVLHHQKWTDFAGRLENNSWNNRAYQKVVQDIQQECRNNYRHCLLSNVCYAYERKTPTIYHQEHGQHTNHTCNSVICRNYMKDRACFKGGNCPYLHPLCVQTHVATIDTSATDVGNQKSQDRSYQSRLSVLHQPSSSRLLSIISIVANEQRLNEMLSKIVLHLGG